MWPRSNLHSCPEISGDPYYTAAEAGEIIRGLIDRIGLTPVDGILKRELYGDLAGIAQFTEAQKSNTKDAGSAAEPALLSVVAGVGFEPTTFRL
jgi:site-specific DNA recombinase